MIKYAIFSVFLGLSACLYAPALSNAAGVGNYPAGDAAGGIGDTRHNMGGLGKVLFNNGTSEICVFCHTPHHSNKGGTGGLSPLWNRASGAPSSYTAYGTTIGGSNVSNTDLGSSTLACLSCHDGVTTFDNIVNTAGKGGLVAGGSDRGWKFYMANASINNTAWDHFDPSTSGPCNTCHVGVLGELANPAVRLTIGTDLANDHPVSVQYSENKASLRPISTVINSIDLTTGLAASGAVYMNNNLAQNRWAVKGFISDTATISDLLRNGKVECSSCHDPHFDNLSWDEAEPTWDSSVLNIPYCSPAEKCSDGNFLRRVGGNTGSGVCRTCHNK